MRNFYMHVQTREQTASSYALIIVEQLLKMILVCGVLNTPVRQGMTTGTQQSQVKSLESMLQCASGVSEKFRCLRQVGEHR
ncbi:hypothetical protein D3C86_1877630 [compost metagenome]